MIAKGRTPMFQRILIPLDGSPRAEQAVSIAAQIAQATQGASLILLQAVNPIDEAGWAKSALHLEESLLEQPGTYLQQVAQGQALAGKTVMTRTCIGIPAEQILATAQNEQADLIVLCSHGRTRITRWAMGSVAQKIARSSPIPVLVLQENDRLLRRRPTQTPSPLRILVALDGSRLAESTIAPAAMLCVALSAPTPGILQFTYVIPLPSSFEYGQNDSVAKALRREAPLAQSYLQSIEQRFRESELASLPLQLTSTIAHDLDIASRLLQVAAQGTTQDGSTPSDILALATHGRGGLRRWMTGSVAERILSSAQIALLIIRP
jgi:nucleotide-binding universal stress UspA family protein